MARLKVRRWPRLKHVVGVMIVVAMRRFLSDGVARKADHQGDRSDNAFDHGLMFPIEKNAHRQACVPTPFILHDGDCQGWHSTGSSERGRATG